MVRQSFQHHTGVSFSVVLPEGWKATKYQWPERDKMRPGPWSLFFRKNDPNSGELNIEISTVSLQAVEAGKKAGYGRRNEGPEYNIGVNLVYDFKMTEKRASSIPQKRIDRDDYLIVESEWFQTLRTLKGQRFFWKNRIIEYDDRKADTRYRADCRYAQPVKDKVVNEKELQEVNQILDSFEFIKV